MTPQDKIPISANTQPSKLELNPIILIAEDIEVCYMVLEITLRMLMPKNYSPNIFNIQSGDKTLETLRTRKDITHLFLDMRLPQISGYDIARTIRTDTSLGYNKLPIIAVTANTREQDRQICLDAGCSDYLSKPVMPNNLNKIVAKYFPPIIL